MQENSNKSGIYLNDILHLTNKEIQKTKIRFMVKSGKFNPVETAKNEEKDKLNLVDLVHNRKKSIPFKKGNIVIGFIRFDKDKWLMTGVVDIIKDKGYLKPAVAQYRDKKYNDRLVVEYHNKGQNIIRNAKKFIDSLEVVEIWDPKKSLNDKIFPGYKNVNVGFLDLKNKLKISEDWENSLKHYKGVYLITDKKNGKHYVGSAYGKNRIYGRWKVYIDKGGYDKSEKENGEYPNAKFKEIVSKKGKQYIENNFQYSILEIFTDDTPIDEIIKRETWWKKVLYSHSPHGYNMN